MSLPKVAMPTSSVVVDGHTLSVRGLTRGENPEVSRLIDAKDIEAAEIFILAAATDTPRDETYDWYRATPNRDVERVLNAIGDLTRLDEDGARKSEAGVHVR